jgi:CRISPR-associated endonuclease/helicase Cas3
VIASYRSLASSGHTLPPPQVTALVYNDTRAFAHSLGGGSDKADWELLGDHLHSVSRRAGAFGSTFGLGPWAAAAGLLHDIGKTSTAFQAYIRGDGNSPDHSTAGAVEAKVRYPQVGPLLAFIIAGHHAGLADGAELTARLRKQLAPYEGWEQLTGPLPVLNAPTFDKGPYPGFCLSFLTRIVFSCLVDADFLETEAFYMRAEDRSVDRGIFSDVVTLRDRLRVTMAGIFRQAADTPLNGIRANVLAHAIGRHACARGIFTMTVPTGGGKTLASLSFALEHAAHHCMRRVIYVAPYTSIIEQTAEVFREALGAADDVLEHHGNFDWEPRQDKESENDPDGLKKLRLASENWDAPVIITTAVQFFESLYANRTSRCRKLHNIAGSVIVLDEVQTLPLKLLRPCMAALEELARNYGASIVLCTATQPALRIMDGALPPDKTGVAQGFDIGPERELAPDPVGLYTALKRVTVEVLPAPIDDAGIAARLAAVEQMLCIVNTRGHAKDLFDLIREQPGARHLTTLMCPAHRRAVLAQIKTDLKESRPVRLVATSLVEAGVDFSFPEVWRAQTGLDSIAQAAGRCNREGGRPAGWWCSCRLNISCHGRLSPIGTPHLSRCRCPSRLASMLFSGIFRCFISIVGMRLSIGSRSAAVRESCQRLIGRR